MNQYTKKSTDTIVCKYRKYVDCSKADFRADMCYRCGWNPAVEAERIERLRKKK